MRRRPSDLVASLLGAAICFASASSAGAQSKLPGAGPPLGAGTVAWMCPHLGPGGGCPRGVEGPPVYDPVRFFCPTITADMLVGLAFNLSTSAQIKDEPAWMMWDVYQVQIVTASATSHSQMMGLLRKVLVRAFGLRYHITNVPAPVYRLTVARGGPKFGHASAKAAQTREEAMAGIYDFSSVQDLITWLNRYYYLGSTLRHPVWDGTGLKGTYDIRLKLGAGVFPSRAPLLALVRKELGLDATVSSGHKTYVVIDGIKHLRGKWTSP
jgi:uncharacterized protein (TIGR03435 family)